MKITRAALLALGLCTLTFAAPGDDPPEWRDRRPRCPVEQWNALEGQPAPSLSLLESWINTDALDWKDLRGNVVLVHMWGSWAGNKDLAHLIELHETHADEGLIVLGVHSKRGAVRHQTVVDKELLPYVVAADTKGTLAEALNVKFWSSYFLVDRDGKVRVAGINKKEDGEDKLYLDHVVEAALAEPWEGQRELVAYKTRAEREAVVPTEWPDTPDKQVNAKDIRGEAGPKLDGLTWLTEQPDIAGKCVLIDLWATWCGPCVRGMPELQELHEKFGQDLVVIGVSDQHPETKSHRDGKPWGDKVTSFLAGKTFTYFQAIDRGARIKRELTVTAIPHVILMDSQGIVRWQGVPAQGPDSLSAELVAQVISADRKQRGEDPTMTAEGTGEHVPTGWPAAPQKKLHASTDLRGKPAPEFHVDQWLTTAPDREGRVTLVDFWATWCGPCRKLIPEMNEWSAHFGDDLVIVGVSDEEASTVEGFLQKVQVDYAMAIDPDARMKNALGVSGIPHVMVIDSQGIVRWQGFPGTKSDPLTRQVLERIVAEDKRSQAAGGK